MTLYQTEKKKKKWTKVVCSATRAPEMYLQPFLYYSSNIFNLCCTRSKLKSYFTFFSSSSLSYWLPAMHSISFFILRTICNNIFIYHPVSKVMEVVECC